MSEPFNTYLQECRDKLATGLAREHAYRPSLENLLRALQPELTVINDPARIACGAPDYILLRGDDPLGYIEAKDVGDNLAETAESEQVQRYRHALGNFMLTNYLEFYWFVGGELRGEATLGRKQGKGIAVDKEGEAAVYQLLSQFFTQEVEPLSTAEALAERMAHLARQMKEAITQTITLEGIGGSFHAQHEAFQKILLPSLTPAEFADMYAQTLTYGLFSARVRSEEVGGALSRDNMHSYLPSTNPFLADFFYQISGRKMPKTVSWLVDDLTKILRRADMQAILRQFGQRTRQEDPIIHFYETFLREYDPALRQKRGVYYTPEPVVSYIVRSLDALLQTHFKRPLGLADPQTLILDPATGTGTFLYFVIQQIYDKLHSMGQAGSWNSYVQQNLLPRLFGFELLMAPYAVAHLKLGVLLQELGYRFDSEERLNIFLTNALSEPKASYEMMGFAGFLSEEGAKAAEVKRDKPIMVVLGNPPYSGQSVNTEDWIVDKVRDYYFIDGVPLGERNPKWLQDDYVKFIRWAQWRIEKTGQGIVAFITNHGFLDNPTFRGMRQQLLQAFDAIYIVDLHGNSKKKEVAPDGSKDKNVFDIQQGVAITIFVKTTKDKSFGKVYHQHIWGERSAKHQALFASSIKIETSWTSFVPNKPFYLFTPQDENLFAEYCQGTSITQILLTNSVGFVTARDHFSIQFTETDIWEVVTDFVHLPVETAREKYQLREDVRDWKVHLAQADVHASGPNKGLIQQFLYRPFDMRYTYYTGTSRGFICMPRTEVMAHMQHPNLGLMTARSNKSHQMNHFLVTNLMTEAKAGESTTQSALFPLYLYTLPQTETIKTNIFSSNQLTRQPNLAPAFIKQAEARLGLTFVVPDEDEIQPPTPAGASSFTPEDIFYYTYAIFHSPTYRGRYAEFLKVDFPRLPLTADVTLFRQLANLGYELVQLHLLSSPAVNQLQTSFPQAGSNQVEKGHPRYSAANGRVYINPTQYFAGISLELWEMQIGGYQPLEKWLKDRVGRVLSFEELYHYQQVVVALAHTQQLMQEIDTAIPSWPLA